MDPMSLMLFGLLAVMLVFMFLNTRKRQKQMKEQQEEKAAKTVPGAKVLLQGGLYGVLTEFDGDDLSKSARVEIAPGVEIEVHSQAVLRVVEPEDEAVDADDEYADDADATAEAIDAATDERPVADDAAAVDTDDKPKA